MAAVTVYRCDVCKETSETITGMIQAEQRSNEIRFYPADADYRSMKLICGQSCAVKLLSQTTEGWKQ